MSNAGILILALVVIFLVAKLRSVLGTDASSQKMLKVVSDKDGKIVEVRLMDKLPVDEALLQKEKTLEEKMTMILNLLFHSVVESFVKGDVQRLKSLTTQEVFSVFEEDIEKRRTKKQVMELSLISQPKIKITTPLSENIKKVTAEFISEQVNVLKNDKARVIEGDPFHIVKMKDVWTFTKEKPYADWTLCETSGQEVHG